MCGDGGGYVCVVREGREDVMSQFPFPEYHGVCRYQTLEVPLPGGTVKGAPVPLFLNCLRAA